MIQQRADALVALIARQRELAVQVQQLEGYRGQLQEVGRAVSRLTPLLQTWAMFEERKIGSVVAPEQIATLLEQIRQLRGRYEADHSSIIGPNRLSSLRGVYSVADTFERALLDAWKSHGSTLVPSVNGEILNVLGGLPALKPSVNAVLDGLRELERGLQQLPAGPFEIEAFETRAARVRQLWDAFDSTHLPPEVLQFLKAAGGTGASLDSLTDSVRKWLSQNDLAGSFRIRSFTAASFGR